MSFPRYPSYKDSGVEWLGEVPAHWDIPQIKRTTYLKARVGWKGLTSEEFREQSFAYLVTGSDFREKFVKWDECYQVEQERYDDDPFIQLQNGDLLITKDGTIGKLAIVSNLDRPACLNSGIFVARPRNTYTTDFMYWILSSNVFSVFCDLESFGSTINHLYQNVFERFAFPAPPESEQTQIAAFLDRETAKIDELVAEQRRLMELLKEKRQAVISHAVTKGLSSFPRHSREGGNPEATAADITTALDSRIRGNDGAVPMKPSGIEWLGDVPAHWVPLQVGKVCRKVADGPHFSPSYVENGVLFLSARNVKVDGWALDDVKYVSENDCDEFDRRVIPEVGDVLYTKGGTTGIARVADLNERFQVWVHIAVLKVRHERVIPHYLAYALNSIGCYEQSQLLTRGATNNDLGLTRMVKIWFALPPSIEQMKIIAFLDSELAQLDTLTAEAQRAIDLLQERRTALISAAVTGQIDVRPH